MAEESETVEYTKVTKDGKLIYETQVVTRTVDHTNDDMTNTGMYL